MVLKVCLLRPTYPDIGLNIRSNSGKSVFPNGVPDSTSQPNKSRLNNSTDNLFKVKAIYEVARVLVIYPMDCTVSGILATDPFLFLFLTRYVTLATPALVFSKWQSRLVVLLATNSVQFTHVH